jgi:predicted lipoprotein with Yx(FWY)xxD motif
MVSFRRSLLLVLGILLIVVACGGTPNTGTNSSSARAMMPTQTHDNQYGYQANNYQNNQRNQGHGQMPPAPTRTLISTKQVNVHGHRETILTTFNGMTLYEHTTDRVPGSNCTGRCAHVWPPLLSKGMVISTALIRGKLTVHRTANGKQVEYNGHPLYTYSGDRAPGQTHGQGVGKVWYVVPIALQRQHY